MFFEDAATHEYAMLCTNGTKGKQCRFGQLATQAHSGDASSQHFTTEIWRFRYTYLLVLLSGLLRVEVFEDLLLCSRHVVPFSFAAVSLLLQQCAVVQSLLCFPFSLSSFSPPLVLIKV